MAVKLEDSNMANYGSEEHKQLRKDAAMKEPAWNNVGQEVGCQIWRIEKFKVKHWPKDRYGEFYGGEFSKIRLSATTQCIPIIITTTVNT